MLIWRGLKPAAIVAAMLSVQSEWKRTERRRAAAPAGSNGARTKGARSSGLASAPAVGRPEDSAALPPRLVLLDGLGGKPGRPVP